MCDVFKTCPQYENTSNGFERNIVFQSHVESIRQINTVEESFGIRVRIFLYWTFSSRDDWEPEFGSNFILKNTISEVAVIDNSPTSVFQNYKRKNWLLRATVSTSFSLHNFPFDSQQLFVSFRVPRVDTQKIHSVSSALPASLTEVSNDGELRNLQSENHTQVEVDKEWEMKHLSTTVKHAAEGEANFKPEYTIGITLARRPYFYLMNIALQNALLVLLCFTVFFIEPTQFVDRMSIVLAILLTTVAFKFSSSRQVPSNSRRRFLILVIFQFASQITTRHCFR